MHQKAQKPRSVFSAAALAYIGDCIYELYVRRHFLLLAQSIEEYNDHVTVVVRCEAQRCSSLGKKCWYIQNTDKLEDVLAQQFTTELLH
ncbi:hypothetical protein Q3G72_015219 [Acer saccharum]|nr:hypothetical protein Q3G72_015219 [Acer saccharum]